MAFMTIRARALRTLASFNICARFAQGGEH